MNLNKLSEQIFRANKAKGFWTDNPKDRNFGELLMLIVSEAAEALEADRDGLWCSEEHKQEADALLGHDYQGNWKAYFEKNIKNTAEDEIADTIIRLLDLCGGYGIDIDWHIANKLRYNATRGQKHGRGY